MRNGCESTCSPSPLMCFPVLGSIIKKNENSFVWEQQQQKRNRWNFEFSSESVCLLRHYKFNVSSILRWTFITDDLFYSNLGKYLFRKNLFWTLHVPISCTYSNFRFVFWRFIKRENNIIHLSPIWSVLGRIPQNFVVKKLTQKNHPLSSSQCGDCNARWVALSNPWLRSQLNPDDWPTPS
jgi:hypothetical protein